MDEAMATRHECRGIMILAWWLNVCDARLYSTSEGRQCEQSSEKTELGSVV